jgi:hypothetical protein
MKLNKKLIFTFLSVFILIASNSYSAPSEGMSESGINLDSEVIEEQGIDGKLTTDKIDKSNFAATATLQGLNKITAKTSELKVKVGGEIEFGKLTIKAHKCWQAPLDQRPESKILLEIFETDAKGVKSRIFYGWMLASSPSLSGLEHPIYDVIALGCKYK